MPGVGELGQPALDETPLRLRPGQVAGALVCVARLGGLTKPAKEIGSGRMCKAVVLKVTARKHRIDEGQSSRWPVPHRHGDGPVQLDHG